MVLDQTENFVTGAVSASISSGATTISVADASVFPDPANGQYNLVLWDPAANGSPYTDPDVEIVRVTGRDLTNDELTVERGQESTSDVAHPETAELNLDLTAKTIDDIDADLTALDGHGDSEHDGTVLHDGQDFDGQGSSSFSNVNGMDVTGETLVSVYPSADTSLAAGAWETLQLDTEKKDENGEFDTSTYQFTPAKTGWYLIDAQAEIRVASTGDDVAIRFRDVTNGANVLYNQMQNVQDTYDPQIFGIRELTAGVNYEVQVRNANSSDDTNASEDREYLDIRFMFR